MVSVNFIKKEIGMFDDVIFSWKVTNKSQTFIVTATFCGGIDEDGEENLYSCICCNIEIQETYRSPKILDSNVLGVLLNRMDMVADGIDEVNGLQILSYKNEDSFDCSIKDIETILKELTGLLIEELVAIDPVPNSIDCV